MVDFYNSTVRPLRVVGGLYVGMLYLQISPQAVQVLVPSYHRYELCLITISPSRDLTPDTWVHCVSSTMIPLARIRDDTEIGQEEMNWLQQLPVMYPDANLASRTAVDAFAVPPLDPHGTRVLFTLLCVVRQFVSEF